jgi:hypothetical protein
MAPITSAATSRRDHILTVDLEGRSTAAASRDTTAPTSKCMTVVIITSLPHDYVHTLSGTHW